MTSSGSRSSGLAPWVSALLARTCDGCRGPGGPLCPACRTAIHGVPAEAVLRPRPDGLPRVMAAAPYAGPVREALVAFKDHDRWGLRGALGAALARSAAALLADSADPRGAVVLVPVPGSPGSARRRDGDHVQELAAVAARRLRTAGLRVAVRPLLVPTRRRRDQVGLRREDRAANLAGALAATSDARRPIPGAGVVVVDDLVTTGATLAECARALRAAGIDPVGAAVVAAAEKGMRAGAAPRASAPGGSTFVL